mgnify:CR=1 FL=1
MIVGLVEAMIKRSKEILKQIAGGIFLYCLLCLGGAYESYYRGVDLSFTARIAGCVIGRSLLGRRGAILIEMTGGQKNSATGLWFCILILTMAYAFISALAIVDVTVAPDYYKNRK